MPLTQFVFESFEQELSQKWELDQSGTSWGWQFDSQWATNGGGSLAAIGLAHGQFAIAIYSDLFDAGTLTVNYRVSTESNIDYLFIDVEGARVFSRSGVWSGTLSYPLTQRLHRYGNHLSMAMKIRKHIPLALSNGFIT